MQNELWRLRSYRISSNRQIQLYRNAVDDVLSTGCVPIVAHIERYECMASNIENVRTIRNMGADIQINASSVTGGGGKNVKKSFVHSLLKRAARLII